MLTIKEIKTLEKIKTKTLSIISLYLNCDQRIRTPEQIRISLKDLLKEISTKIDKKSSKRIKDYLRLRLKPQVRGLAFFVCPKIDLWKIYEAPRAFVSQVVCDISPYTRPLIKLLDEFERYCVVVLDKEKARVFTVHLGEIEEYKDIFTYPKFPGKHDQGGWSQLRMQRHAEVHVRRLINSITKQIFSFFRKNNFDRLIIAGSKEVLPEFEKNLHPYLKKRLAGKFLTELFMPLRHFLDQSLKIEEQAEREKETELVKKLRESIGRDKGVAGLGKVLSVAQKKELQILLVLEGFKKSGKVCDNCGFISISPQFKDCPFCKEKMKETEDVIEKLIEKALEQDAKVEFVKDSKELEKMGKVGAILRF